MNQISITALAGLGSAVPLGLWVSIYIWLIGISAGSYALTMGGNLGHNPHLKKIVRLGIVLSLSTLLVGLLSIQIDLGRVERFYRLFTAPNPSSVLIWSVYLYGIYLVVLGVSLLRVKKGLPRLFSLLAGLFALGIIIVESLLFARPPGKEWHSALFPIHFLTSSLASAIGALILVSAVFTAQQGKAALLDRLARIALPIIGINLVVDLIDMIVLTGAGHLEKWLVLALSLAVLALLLTRNPVSVTIAGFLALITVLFSKYGTLISAQVVEPFKGFASAYIEPRLSFSYAPNFFEILVSVFLVGLAACLLFLLYRVLPWTRED